MRNFLITIVSICFLLVFACNSPFIPKEKGYANFTFPKKSYQTFQSPAYPYSFEYPTYAYIDNQINYFGESKSKDAWINIQFPNLNGTLYVSFKNMRSNQLDTLINDAYKFASNHSNKATFIADSVFTTEHGVHGVFFHIGGDVATAYQFFLTDSTQHFFRGALYFNTTPNSDSLSIYNDFLFKDLQHLVNTFQWK
jgi:gliding motility-associated lipoprotein GldD